MSEELTIFINGEFLPESKVRISPFDHGLLYGDGVWDTAYVYNGYIFKLDEHLNRLFNSAKAIYLTIPLSKDQFREAIVETVRKNGFREAFVKYLVTRGVSPYPLITARCKSPTTLVSVFPPPELATPEKQPKGKTAIIVSVRNLGPQFGIEPRVKNLSYLNHYLMSREATSVGAAYGIALDLNGFVAEGSNHNLFEVKEGVLYTPPLMGILEGITRTTVFELASRKGFQLVEKCLTPYDLYTADEVFLTTTGNRGIIPIIEINKIMIGEGKPGIITEELFHEYWGMLQNGESGSKVF